jgi:prophage DNA circulation protein
MSNQKYIPEVLGFYLDIVDINDNIDNALVVKEFPYSSKNIIENLGPKTRRVSIACQFNNTINESDGWNIGHAFYPTYDNLDSFMSAFRVVYSSITLTHPDYGEINGKIDKLTIKRDETEEYADVTFDFLEIISQNPQYSVGTSYKVAGDFRATTDETIGKIEDEEKATFNPTVWAANANKFIGKLDANLNKITNPATSIVNTITYASTVPGQMMQSINKAIDRIVNSYVDIVNMPAQFINNIILGVRQLKSIFTGIEAQQVHIMGASRVSYEVMVVYENDTVKNSIITTKEQTKSFDDNGNFIGSTDFDPSMTIDELEGTLYETRLLIDEVLDFDRDNRDLQNTAKTLQDYINNVKLDRQRIEIKENVPFQSMHTWVTNNNLSYQSAEMILKMNPSIKNPTFIDGTLKILV